MINDRLICGDNMIATSQSHESNKNNCHYYSLSPYSDYSAIFVSDSDGRSDPGDFYDNIVTLHNKTLLSSDDSASNLSHISTKQNKITDISHYSYTVEIIENINSGGTKSEINTSNVDQNTPVKTGDCKNVRGDSDCPLYRKDAIKNLRLLKIEKKKLKCYIDNQQNGGIRKSVSKCQIPSCSSSTQPGELYDLTSVDLINSKKQAKSKVILNSSMKRKKNFGAGKYDQNCINNHYHYYYGIESNSICTNFEVQYVGNSLQRFNGETENLSSSENHYNYGVVTHQSGIDNYGLRGSALHPKIFSPIPIVIADKDKIGYSPSFTMGYCDQPNPVSNQETDFFRKIMNFFCRHDRKKSESSGNFFRVSKKSNKQCQVVDQRFVSQSKRRVLGILHLTKSSYFSDESLQNSGTELNFTSTQSHRKHFFCC